MVARARHRRGTGPWGALLVVLAPLLCAATPAATTPKTIPATANWTVYHHDPEGHGVAGKIDLADPHQVWSSPRLDGQLYTEPLVVGSTVLVATENDTVYALNAATGGIRWSRHLGPPVRASQLPCGDISPTLGITSTPVIDPSRGEVFVVADIASSDGPLHQLVGLQTSTGAVELRQNVDPPGIDTAATLQRVALTIDGGRVVFGYGGNYGDCSTYHGWIVSVPETGGALSTYEVDSGPGQDEGAVWMGGAAPVVDPAGNIWFTVGNGSVISPGAPYDGSDAVIETSASLRSLQFFAPGSWAVDNAHDLDLGSSPPALLGDGLVVQAGKSHVAYLLSGSNLGGIGGEQASLGTFCDTDVSGGDAVVGSTVFLPCMSGLVAVAVTADPPGLRVQWRAPGIGGPPIVAGGLVWSIGQDGVLYGLDPGSGSVVDRLIIGVPANHFPTPSAGDGRLFAPGFDQVHAFADRSKGRTS